MLCFVGTSEVNADRLRWNYFRRHLSFTHLLTYTSDDEQSAKREINMITLPFQRVVVVETIELFRVTSKKNTHTASNKNEQIEKQKRYNSQSSSLFRPHLSSSS